MRSPRRAAQTPPPSLPSAPAPDAPRPLAPVAPILLYCSPSSPLGHPILPFNTARPPSIPNAPTLNTALSPCAIFRSGDGRDDLRKLARRLHVSLPPLRLALLYRGWLVAIPPPPLRAALRLLPLHPEGLPSVGTGASAPQCVAWPLLLLLAPSRSSPTAGLTPLLPTPLLLPCYASRLCSLALCVLGSSLHSLGKSSWFRAAGSESRTQSCPPDLASLRLFTPRFPLPTRCLPPACPVLAPCRFDLQVAHLLRFQRVDMQGALTRCPNEMP